MDPTVSSSDLWINMTPVETHWSRGIRVGNLLLNILKIYLIYKLSIIHFTDGIKGLCRL